MHEKNCFVTLTYDDEHLPADGGLDYREFQLFMKRLRKRVGKVRFFMCGEYGNEHRRPHYHACLFGVDFDDKSYWQTGKSGCRIYRSKLLEALWPFGFSTVGDVTFDSAGYTARYVLKKGLGRGSERSYVTTDLETGEVYQLQKEFSRCSLKPGIGASWFQKYRSDVFPADYCIISGVRTKPPRYYGKLLDREDKDMHNSICERREQLAVERRMDNTPERLAVKEKVLGASLKFLHREVE